MTDPQDLPIGMYLVGRNDGEATPFFVRICMDRGQERVFSGHDEHVVPAVDNWGEWWWHLKEITIRAIL